jgi:hypothetical protein
MTILHMLEEIKDTLENLQNKGNSKSCIIGIFKK